MKRPYLRLGALLLAALLLAGAGPFPAAAAELKPGVKLGTTPADMLSGGGLQVSTPWGTYRIDTENGTINRFIDDGTEPDEAADPADGQDAGKSSAGTPVYNRPAACLNYWNGLLYFAALGDGQFDVCRLNLGTGAVETLLSDFAGEPRQLYVVNGSAIQFSCSDAIWELVPETGEVRLIRQVENLFSFVPTGCGPIIAVGELFDYSLYAGGRLLAEHVIDYYVDYEIYRQRDGVLFCSAAAGSDKASLKEVFLGEAVLFAEEEEAEAPSETEEPDETEEPAEPEAAEPEETFPEFPDPEDLFPQFAENEDPADGEAEEAFAADAVEAAPVCADSAGICTVCADPTTCEHTGWSATDGAIRRPTSQGALNVMKRARQMLNVKWTPVKNVKGWGYTDSTYTLRILYKAGVTYTGIPYCQGCNYVPWTTSLSEFVANVNNGTSKFYTQRSTYGRGGPYNGTDCSGFVSWAWDMPTRTVSITPYADKISNPSYSKLQIGDMLSRSGHAMLVTDVIYDTNGVITTVEISHANPTEAHTGCCYSMTFTGSSLAKVNNYFTSSGYGLYRYKNLDSVTYTHDCTVPLEGDVCSVCGAGMFLKPGVDVSQWQGNIDWQTASDSLSFAIIRVGSSSDYTDPKFETNALGCENAGLPYGVYLYAKATTPEQAMAEADKVLQVLLSSGFFPDLPIFYDVEYSPMLDLSNEELLQVVSAFCQAIEDAGFRAGVYACTNVWNTKLTGDGYNAWVRWVAQWQDSLTPDGGANVWQYSSQGQIDGIPTVVDLDYWFGPLGDETHRYQATTDSPSCTEPGSITYVCVECGLTFTKDLPAAGHSFEETQTSAPTCTTPGSVLCVCSVCGYACTVELPAMGHSYQKSRSAAPTCTAAGSETYVCKACGDTYTDVLPALGHNFVDGACTRCGVPEDVFSRYTDLDPGRWFSDAAEFCIRNGLFNGVTDTLFEPKGTMNRAMTVTVLYRVAGEPEVDAGSPFSDIPASQYYAAPVAWAAMKGIAEGMDDGMFNPYENVTREQMAAFFFRTARAFGMDVSERGNPEVFPDWEDASEYAQEPLSWAVAVGLLQGSGENGQVLLLPCDCATRAQVAVILQRFCNLLQAQGLWTPVS